MTNGRWHERKIALDPSWDVELSLWRMGYHPEWMLPVLVRPEIASVDIRLCWPDPGAPGLPEWRWRYHRAKDALAAAHAWLDAGCAGEPRGWFDHPATGRRR